MPLVTIRDRNSNATQFQVEVAFDNCAPYQVDFANPYDEYQEQLFAWYFEGWLYNPHLDTVRAAEAANLLQNYGKKLFVDVIQSNPEVYQQYVYLRKDLSQVQIEIEGNSPEFQALHWEAIQDPELPTPLGVECVILRKAARPAVTPVSIKTYPTINLLIVTARPDQENDAAYRTISRPLIQAIRNAELKVKIDLLRPGTYEALSRQLEAKGNGYYHIVHFDTHGALLEYEQLTSERVKSRFIYGDRFGRKDLKPYEGVEAFIFLEGQTKGKADPVKAEELAGLLTNRGIPLCILNACQSGQQLLRITAALEEIDSRETSLGSRLMVAGMELVVAMGYSVTVTAAEIMMEQLYTNLFQDSDFQRAIRLGRKELWNRKSRRAQYNQSIDLEDWILPVVYANGTLDLNLRDFTPDEEEEYWDSVASQYQFIPPPSDFIGRDLDILLIEQALIKHNILLLRGMGGTGKTTLLSYLREWWQITNFAQEIFYFGYDERAWNLEQIVLEIAKQLYPGKYDYFNFQAMKPPARASKLKSKLRAESHIIILDNLESVTGQPLAIQNTLDTPEQKLIKQFLTQLAGGKTKIILGSRSGETWLQPTTFKENIYQLGGLDPEARTLLAEKILERVAPTRKTSIRENGDFKRLMNLLAGYPLAMEVVLSNLKQQTAAEIINQLDAADIQSLGGADKTNNIVKCIEYSHSNLSPQAQELLLCLAPFRKFIDTSDIPNYVKQLQQFEPFRDYQPETLASAIEEATNWGLLSPINPDYPSLLTIQPVLPYFLQTKLKETDTREALRQAFNQHYQGLGNLYFQYMQSKEAEKRQIGITFVRLEYENLYQGLQINLEQQTSPYAIWQCLYKYLDLTSNYPQQLQFTEAVYDALEAYPPEKRNATWEEHIVPISGNLANSYLRNQDYDRAHKTYQQALTQIAQLQNIEENQKQSYQATIYHQIGMVAQELREYDQAQQYYRQALNLKIKSGDRFALATTFHQLGRVTQKLREYNLAIAYYQEALNLKIEYGDRFSQATTFHQLGKVAEELREYNQARDYYYQALDIYIEYGDRYNQADTFHQLGNVALELREYDQARQYYQQALDIYIEYGDRYQQAATYHNLGNIALELGEYDQAQQYYQQALDLFIEFGDRYNQVSTYYQLGIVAQKLKEYDQAHNYYQQALDIYVEYGDRYEQASTYHQLGSVAQELREYDQAQKYYQQALDIYIEFGDRFSQASTYHQLGNVALKLREYEQVRQYYQQALDLFIEFGDLSGQARTNFQLGKVAEALGELESAQDYYLKDLELTVASNDEEDLGISLGNLARFYSLTQNETLIASAAQLLNTTEEEVREWVGKINL